MVNVITQLFKYMVALIMAIYTIRCFTVFSVKKEKKKRRKRDKRAFVPEPVAKAPNPQVIETPNQNVVESFVSNEPIKPKRVAQIKDIRFSKKVVKRKAEKFDVKNDFKLSSKQEK